MRDRGPLELPLVKRHEIARAGEPHHIRKRDRVASRVAHRPLTGDAELSEQQNPEQRPSSEGGIVARAARQRLPLFDGTRRLAVGSIVANTGPGH